MAVHTHTNLLFIWNSSCNRAIPYYSLTGYSFGTPQADQYAPQVPPPPTTPGSAPLGFAPATTPTQDLSKAPTGQPDFSYSQYGKRDTAVVTVFFLPLTFSFEYIVGPARLLWHLVDTKTIYLDAYVHTIYLVQLYMHTCFWHMWSTVTPELHLC